MYINFVDLYSSMLHSKFQNHTPPGSEEEDCFKIFVIYSHGGHLGNVTMTIYANFHSLVLTMLNIKFGFDWPSGFREEDVRIFWSYTCLYPGTGADNPLGLKYYHMHKSSVHLLIPSKFSAIK